MNCPICHSKQTKVIDTRSHREVCFRYRTRECTSCKKRFTTSETPVKPEDESTMSIVAEIKRQKGYSEDEWDILEEEE